MKLSSKGQKILKAVHILTAVCWVGGALSLFALNHFTGDFAFGDNAYGLNYAKHAVDVAVVIIPGAVGCFLTGLCYSLFTPWGFFKHGFIAAKWILTLALYSRELFISDRGKGFCWSFPKRRARRNFVRKAGNILLPFMNM